MAEINTPPPKEAITPKSPEQGGNKVELKPLSEKQIEGRRFLKEIRENMDSSRRYFVAAAGPENYDKYATLATKTSKETEKEAIDQGREEDGSFKYDSFNPWYDAEGRKNKSPTEDFVDVRHRELQNRDKKRKELMRDEIMRRKEKGEPVEDVLKDVLTKNIDKMWSDELEDKKCVLGSLKARDLNYGEKYSGDRVVMSPEERKELDKNLLNEQKDQEKKLQMKEVPELALRIQLGQPLEQVMDRLTSEERTKQNTAIDLWHERAKEGARQDEKDREIVGWDEKYREAKKAKEGEESLATRAKRFLMEKTEKLRELSTVDKLFLPIIAGTAVAAIASGGNLELQTNLVQAEAVAVSTYISAKQLWK